MIEVWYKEFRDKNERSLDIQQYRKLVEKMLCKGEYDEREGPPHKSMNDYDYMLFRGIMKHILFFIEDFENRLNRLEEEAFLKKDGES